MNDKNAQLQHWNNSVCRCLSAYFNLKKTVKRIHELWSIHFYPNVTTLRSGTCNCKFFCLSVVYNVRAPYSAGWNFRQCFYAVSYPSHLLTFTQNFMEIVQGKLFRCWTLSKAISRKRCKIRPRVQLMTNRKSYPENLMMPLWTLYGDPR